MASLKTWTTQDGVYGDYMDSDTEASLKVVPGINVHSKAAVDDAALFFWRTKWLQKLGSTPMTHRTFEAGPQNGVVVSEWNWLP